MRRSACIALAPLLLAGCVTVTRPAGPEPPSVPSAASVIGRSIEGRPLAAVVLGHGPQVTLIVAGIHGDEPAGGPLLAQLERHLLGHPELIEGRTVVLVPEANPDGLAARSRANANGVDLNRNFPAGNWRETRRNGPLPLSEPEALAIVDLIRAYRPQRIVSIHQPLSCVDYDGPAEDLARSIAGACGLPVRKLGNRSGSLGSYAGETLGIATITLELPGGAHRQHDADLWARYGSALLAAVRHDNDAARLAGTADARSPAPDH